MTGPELEAARHKLRLTAAQLGRALELTGRDPGRDVRRWETGAFPQVPGPVRVAVRYMLAEAEAKRREARQLAAAARQVASLRDSGFMDLTGPPAAGPEFRAPTPGVGRRRGKPRAIET
jgi:hypothetical protein